MTALYVPPTEESDHKKQNMSLQLLASEISAKAGGFDSRTAAVAATISKATDVIRTGGYTAAGDGGGGLYKRVAVAPSHAGKFQSADGAWWELVENNLSLKQIGAALDGATDDTTACSNAATYCRSTGARMYVPGGSKMRIVTGAIDLSGVYFYGFNVFDDVAAYEGFGSIIELTSTTVTPFVVGNGSVIKGLQFYWPNQLETGSAPIVYPALFNTGAAAVVDFRAEDNVFLNAYDVFLLGADSSGALVGRISILNNSVFALRRFIDVRQAPDYIEVAGNKMSIGIYQDVALGGATFALRNFAAANAVFVRVAASLSFYGSADGMLIRDNFVFGTRYGVQVTVGHLSVSIINNNYFDGVSTALSLENSATFESVTFQNNTIYAYRFGDRTQADPAVFLDAVGSTGEIVIANNKIWLSDGNAIESAGTPAARVFICDNFIRDWGSTTSVDAERVGISVDMTGVEGKISGNKLTVDKTIATLAVGISIVNGTVAVQANHVYGPVTSFRIAGGTVDLSGNSSANDTTGLQVTGGTVRYGWNYLGASGYSQMTAGAVTVASTTATPASGSTAARLLFGTTAAFGIYFGSGAPTVSAAQGSLYLRSDGSSTSTRAYINTNGSTTWTAITTAT